MATVIQSGSITATSSKVVLTPSGDGYCTIQAYGTFASCALTFQGLVQGSTTYVPIQALRNDGSAMESTTSLISVATTWRCNIAGFKSVEVTCPTFGTGTVNIVMATDNIPVLYNVPSLADGQSGLLYDNSFVLENVQYAQATVTASSTDTALVTAPAAKSIRILQLSIGCNATATVAVQLNTKPAGAGTIIWGPTGITASSLFSLPFNKHGYCQAAAANGVTVTTSTGGTVGVNVAYITV